MHVLLGDQKKKKSLSEGNRLAQSCKARTIWSQDLILDLMALIQCFPLNHNHKALTHTGKPTELKCPVSFVTQLWGRVYKGAESGEKGIFVSEASVH